MIERNHYDRIRAAVHRWRRMRRRRGDSRREIIAAISRLRCARACRSHAEMLDRPQTSAEQRRRLEHGILGDVRCTLVAGPRCTSTRRPRRMELLRQPGGRWRWRWEESDV